jgi:cbb3-type cytochrome oxidase maturation protein
MESLALLIPLSVGLVLLIGWVFWRALQGGQFDDLERPGYSILDDDDTSTPSQPSPSKGEGTRTYVPSPLQGEGKGGGRTRPLHSE